MSHSLAAFIQYSYQNNKLKWTDSDYCIAYTVLCTITVSVSDTDMNGSAKISQLKCTET